MQRHMQQETDTQLSKLLLIKSEFELAFFHANSISDTDRTILFKYQNDNIFYHFAENAIIRKESGISDTLFSGNYSYRVLREDKFLSRLVLYISQNGNEYQLTFDKTYFPNFLLRNKELSFEY